MTTEGTEPAFEELLEFLKSQRGFDFTGYKRASLERRLVKRMQTVGVSGYGEYREHLELNADEFTALFDTLLINVTSFFRDAEAWKYVDEQIIPALLEARADGELRIWSAGCASGQEAYSIAMLLARAMGEDAFRSRVKVYATDIDEDALTEARQATYSPAAVEDVPQELRERYFDRGDTHYTFGNDLRRAVIFGRNDLVQDAPISRIDLLLSRNTLMYFTAETQSRILNRFNFALRPTGYLFLGRSEMLLTHGDLFTPVDLKCRVFTKVPRAGLRERLAFLTNGQALAGATGYEGLRDGAFDLSPVAQILVDRDGVLQGANQEARRMFGLGRPDVGRPLQDLEVSYRPVELRAGLDQAYAEGRQVGLGEVPYRMPGGHERKLQVTIAPLPASDDGALGATITFADVTEEVTLREELERSRRELEVAYEELQSTVEELETTNEELQSTNEELETTNEELQSTNEELETTNEELQSTNEELETMNDELRERTREVDDVNMSLEAILDGLGVGVAVLDAEQVVRMWNAKADDLWGLRQEEAVGRHVFGLDIGLPVENLRALLREALAGRLPTPVVVDATNRRGRNIQCRVSAVPLAADGDGVRGAIVLMESVA